jgi:hypothetical protein
VERQRWWESVGQDQLRQLLYWRWDPIGINSEFPNTNDEYDHYAEAMRELLLGDLVGDELEARVLEALRQAQVAMGLEEKTGAEDSRQEAAALVLTWRDRAIRMWR